MVEIQANRSFFVTGQAVIAVTDTAVQLPDQEIPNGFKVVVKRLTISYADTAVITVGTSSAVNSTINGTGNGFVLLGRDDVELRVDNLNRIWINGTAGEGICYITETD